MSTNKTQNLNLHAWEATDAVKREEFNENFAAIDENAGRTWAEVTQKAELVTGSYFGDGAETRTISLGFTPKAIFVTSQCGVPSGGQGAYISIGLALPGCPMRYTAGTVALAVVNGGFQVAQNTSIQATMNRSNEYYYYVAIK